MSSHTVPRLSTNPVTDKLRNGQASVGSWISLCTPVAAESMAQIGWDWLVVDAQHSPVGFETMINCFRAIQLGGALPMARVPWNDTIWIQRTLDAGAFGLVIPMVNSAAEARAAVANTKYATRGQRSYTTNRLAAYVDGDYPAWADEHLTIMVMIETIQAVEQAEAILSVDGVVGCFIGPNDLALSMGISTQDPQLEVSIMRVLDAARATGKAAGKHCSSAAEVGMRIRQGFQFLALLSDSAFLLQAAQQTFRSIDVGHAQTEHVQDQPTRLY